MNDLVWLVWFFRDQESTLMWDCLRIPSAGLRCNWRSVKWIELDLGSQLCGCNMPVSFKGIASPSSSASPCSFFTRYGGGLSHDLCQFLEYWWCLLLAIERLHRFLCLSLHRAAPMGYKNHKNWVKLYLRELSYTAWHFYFPKNKILAFVDLLNTFCDEVLQKWFVCKFFMGCVMLQTHPSCSAHYKSILFDPT